MKRIFFKIRINSFWSYQIFGWLVFYISDLLLTVTISSPTLETIAIKTLKIISGFTITLCMRFIYRKIKYQNLSFLNIFFRTLLISIIPSILQYCLIVTYIFTIRPWNPKFVYYYTFPNYLRELFFLLPIFWGWSILYFSIKFWLDWNNEKERAKRSISLAQSARLETLKYQLNPHFLFNALNTARALVDENEKRAKTLITELSEFLRYSLISKNSTLAALKDELDAIKHYLSIEKKRFEDKLDVSYELDIRTEKIMIPCFLIHPLVENAVKNGMRTSPMPVRIKIKTFLSGNRLFLQVINSGKISSDKYRKEDPSLEYINNLKIRLINAYSDNYKFEIKEKDGYVYTDIEIMNPEGVMNEKDNKSDNS